MFDYDYRQNEDYVRNVLGLAGPAKDAIWQRFGPGIMDDIEKGVLVIPSPLDALSQRAAESGITFDDLERVRREDASRFLPVVIEDNNAEHSGDAIVQAGEAAGAGIRVPDQSPDPDRSG